MQRNAMPTMQMKSKCRNLNGHTLIKFINGISTDIDILSEQFVRNPVFIQNIIVCACASKGRAEKEAEDSVIQNLRKLLVLCREIDVLG